MEKLNDGTALYSYRWQQMRAAWLKRHPLCVFCEALGLVVAADVVDHRTPHRGDPVLFWDQDNWQSLCKKCHDSAKQKEEKQGHSSVVDDDGWPIDVHHPANSGKVLAQGGVVAKSKTRNR